MLRAVPILAAQVLVAGIALWVAPWAIVPAAAVGLFGGGWLSGRASDDRDVRRAVAWRVGLGNGVLVAVLWWVFGGTDPAILAAGVPTRLGLASGLGFGVGVASMGLALIGLDARSGPTAPL